MSIIYRMLLLLLLLAGFLPGDVEGYQLGRMGLKVQRPRFKNSGNRGHFVLSRVARHANPSRLSRRDRFLIADWSKSLNMKSAIMSINNTQQATEVGEVEILSTFKAGVTRDALGILSSWRSNDSSVCHWEGVTCALHSGSSRVVAIQLGSSGLVGTMSPSLGGLTFLESLDLSNNSFSGSIPTSLMNCSQLSYLALDENEFDGEIPSQLGDLIGLQILNLSSNFLKGVIPVSIVNCSSLSFLGLGHNNLTGEIPLKLGQAIHLEVVSLAYNSLSGSIPASLGNCTSLVELHFDVNFDLVSNIPAQLQSLRKLEQLTAEDNNLGGTFPSWMGNLTALVRLELGTNTFMGDIPDVFGQLKNLKFFDISDNNFTGNFPVSLTNCSSMVEISVTQNLLTGDLPPAIGRLQNLEILFVSINMMSAVLPSSLSNCSSLRYLSVGEALFSATQSQTVPSWLSTMVYMTAIELFDMGLVGAIPPELANLPNLIWLALWGNKLTGKIPVSLGNLTNLIVLSLSGNQLSGNIPTELGPLVNLNSLFLYDNQLTGPLPTFIANFTQLTYFEVHFNNLDGPIQTDFGALRKLIKVRLYNNSFTGPIPVSLGNCSNLFSLEILNNQFSGSISPSLGNISELGRLDVSNNRLQGGIPVELIGCTILNSLVLSENLLDGLIPPEIFQLRYLQTFQASNNRLSGVVPSSLGSCQSLLDLDLSYNSLSGILPAEAFDKLSLSLNTLVVSNNLLSGPVPVQLSLLENVVRMDLSVNNFSGSIPAGLSRCTSLENLDLSFNNLTGIIPETLGKLPLLEKFNVSYNHLQGPIPDFGAHMTNISAASFLGNTGLCGNILSTKCPPAAPPDLQAHPVGNNSCHGFRCESVWIPVASVAPAIISITVVALVILKWRSHRVHNEKLLRNTQESQLTMFSNFLGLKAKDIQEIIDKEENIIGAGGMSVVYKVTLPGGEMFAAKVLRIKRQEAKDIEAQQAGVSEHLREVQMLAKLRHRNIVKLSGYFSSPELKAIIMEYLPQGSLEKHLHGGEVCELTWAVRLNISLGVAEGLVYLHEYFHEPIIHRDLKPSNILLDGNFEPKVGDFGISKFVNPWRVGEATASTFCGTTGYVPPEYGMSNTISTSGDVYSFGVILLELVTKKQPTDFDSFEGSGDLLGWVLNFQNNPAVLLDSAILPDESRADSRVELQQINLLVKVGLLCTQEAPQNRPGMTDVLTMLNHIKRTGSALANYQTVEELVKETTDCIPQLSSHQTAMAGSSSWMS